MQPKLLSFTHIFQSFFVLKSHNRHLKPRYCTPKFCILFVYSLPFFISTHHSTKQKQSFYLLISFFSITKQPHKRSKIDKSIFYLPIFIIQKIAFISQQTLNKCKTTLTPCRTNIIYKKQQGNYFFCIFVLSLCLELKRKRHRNK